MKNYIISLDNSDIENSILDFDGEAGIAIRMYTKVGEKYHMHFIEPTTTIIESDRMTLDELNSIIDEFFNPDVVGCRLI